MENNYSKQLAVLGGDPAFKDHPLHVNKPAKVNAQVLYSEIDSILESQIYTNDGRLIRTLEEKICELLNVRHCVVVSNGTMGLQLALEALELRGEVILPAFTFIATANAVRWKGLTPVFCDIDPVTQNLSTEHCEKLINEHTAAILGVHLWGRACDIHGLERIAKERNIPLLFDAAHAFGCKHIDRHIGSLGTLEVFSFHANKIFHCGEGGAITTNDDALAQRLRSLRNFGFCGYDCTDGIGINGKLSELNAALGLANLEEYPTNLVAARDTYARYERRLAGHEFLSLIEYPEENSRQYIVLNIAPESPLNRDLAYRSLLAENILARRYFFPGCHRLAPYGSPADPSSLPATEHAAAHVLVLPGGANIIPEHVDRVCDLLLRIFDEHEQIKKALHA